MSIDSISKLKNFGVFVNHANQNASKFVRYNLFFGWNGSGKSTLSNLFRCLEKKSTSNKFPSAEFAIRCSDGKEITQKNVSESSFRIYTFNRDFVDENISWNSVVKSILLVDRERIEERKKLEDLKEQQRKDLDEHEKEDREIDGLDQAIAKFESDSARRMKNSLQAIDTTDKYYLNYDKRKFEAFVKENLAERSDEALLDDKEITELTRAAKPDHRPTISFSQEELSANVFAKAESRLDSLLKTSVVSQAIQRLLDHVDIKEWVEAGLDLHKRNGVSHCEFCGGEMSEVRLRQLEAHFNDEYRAFQDRLNRASQWLDEQYVNLPELPPASDLYDELKREYGENCEALERAVVNLNGEISAWHDVLREKISSPLNTSLAIRPIAEITINGFNGALSAVHETLRKHNHKSNNFKEETNKAKRRLELHYAETEIRLFGYHEKKQDLLARKEKNKKLNEEISARRLAIREIEAFLSNEGLGAEAFNKSLHKFLGRSELTLRFNEDKKGYEIIRNDVDLVDGNLSEGERAAIAFVYFITKMKENGNNIEETIVVIDDPISSFDSNHLFNAFSFMKMNCENAKQLFILTHNFTFFKLVRDWIVRKNKKEFHVANCYVVRVAEGKPRCATFVDAEPALKSYNSEYHYIFSRLYAMKGQKTLETDDHFLAANLARKLLESFFSFKFPKSRGAFANLFDVAVLSSKDPGDERREKIRKFINKYSHSDVIEINDDYVENLVGESVTVIEDIFEWIREFDQKHYEEMLEVVA